MKKIEDKKCSYCGKLFHPARKTREFCSRECSANYRKENGGYIISKETKEKMSSSHIGLTRIPKQLQSLSKEKIKQLKRDMVFGISKYKLLEFCVTSSFPGTKKWPADHPIWDCNVAGKLSPREAWNNPEYLIKAIDNLYYMLVKGLFDYTSWVMQIQDALYHMDRKILEVVLYRFTIAKIAPKVTALMPSTFEKILKESGKDISNGIYCPMAGFGGIIEGAKRYYEKNNIDAEIEAYDINPIFCKYYGWTQRDILAQHIKTNKTVFVCPPFGPNTERWKGTPDTMYYEFEEWVKFIKEYIDAPDYIFVGPEVSDSSISKVKCGLFSKKYGIQLYAPESTDFADEGE